MRSRPSRQRDREDGPFVPSMALLLLWAATASCAAQTPATPAKKAYSSDFTTSWGRTVTPENVWRSYPRPQMQREKWLNLNGLWDYAIRDQRQPRPQAMDGKILVPFAVESKLSGVARALTPNDRLWYRRRFTVPGAWRGQRVLLHFGAVDFETHVWVNDGLVGSHRGGFDAFSFDITHHLHPGENTLEVQVADPTDTQVQPRGKQTLEPNMVFYTAVSGIWQTVWLEPAPALHIAEVRASPDIDAGKLAVEIVVRDTRGLEKPAAKSGTVIRLTARAGGQVIATETLLAKEGTRNANRRGAIALPNAHLWSPEDPFLYALDVELLSAADAAAPLDAVQSYFAMRKVSIGPGLVPGQPVILLNNRPLFQNGTLDQGYWPDGLFTPPAEEAMEFELKFLKRAGFNMVRKHLKVEPAQYYHAADRLGVLIWQDLPSGMTSGREELPTGKQIGEEGILPYEAMVEQDSALMRMVLQLHAFPSIAMWVIHNEGWGQYAATRLGVQVKALDPTRLVNKVSGGMDTGDAGSDVFDVHDYEELPKPPVANAKRAIVMGEFGGTGLSIKGHLWDPKARHPFYRLAGSIEEFTRRYRAQYEAIGRYARERGLSAAVYTQTTDVEAEINGLLTYDRAVEKIPAEALRRIHAATLFSGRYGAWGVDLAARDLTVKPGDDFFHYASGGYFAYAQFPPDRAAVGVWDQLFTHTEENVRDLIQSLPERASRGSLEQKVGDYYRAFLDTAAIERKGMQSARKVLGAIAATRTHEEIVRLMHRPDLPLRSPLSLEVTVDEKNPDRYAVAVEAATGAYGLPDRDYYFKSEQTFVDIREKYRAHLERMFTLAGEPQGARQAQVIFDLERKIAARHWPREKLRERELTYNPRTLQALKSLAPGYAWDTALAVSGLGARKAFILGALQPIEKISQLVSETPVAAWQSYLKYHFLTDTAGVLSQALDEERFVFQGRVLNGQQEQTPRWKRAVSATSSALGEAVGQLYVQRHFPPASKAQMLELVENLREAFRKRLTGLAWMSAETKSAAFEKLATFRPKIGYPDTWRDYAALEVSADDAFGNLINASRFEWARDLARLDRPTDRDEWFTTPQTVNAFYNSTFNEIVFPAAFLQPPFFDPQADPAVNYGAIGAVIGHEMCHGFDDQGAKSDAKGVLRTWWRADDEQAFKELGERLATQFDQYEVLPGLNVRGRLVLGENIADLCGVQVAYDAYRLSLGGREPPLIDGLTGEQRFFLAFAQIWRVKFREERLRSYVMRDPHSPPEVRVNGILRNIDAWYAAFDVSPGDKLYLKPEDRIAIW